MPKFDIIVDTREKQPWAFPSDHKVVAAKLDCGDYAIETLWDKLCIERKGSVQEIAVNVTENRWPAFLEKMADYEYKFMICEFTYNDLEIYPAQLPMNIRKRIKVKGGFLFKKLLEIQLDYGIHVCLCGNEIGARNHALFIMNQVYQRYK